MAASRAAGSVSSHHACGDRRGAGRQDSGPGAEALAKPVEGGHVEPGRAERGRRRSVHVVELAE
jgi:hypothetical protein